LQGVVREHKAGSDGISLQHWEMVILGTQYAGEMKKGVFT
jgi:ATP-dependent phosphoenolpyruvate carboxykinase